MVTVNSSPCDADRGDRRVHRVGRADLGVDEGVDERRLALLELADDGDRDAGAADVLAVGAQLDDRSVRPDRSATWMIDASPAGSAGAAGGRLRTRATGAAGGDSSSTGAGMTELRATNRRIRSAAAGSGFGSSTAGSGVVTAGALGGGGVRGRRAGGHVRAAARGGSAVPVAGRRGGGRGGAAAAARGWSDRCEAVPVQASATGSAARLGLAAGAADGGTNREPAGRSETTGPDVASQSRNSPHESQNVRFWSFSCAQLGQTRIRLVKSIPGAGESDEAESAGHGRRTMLPGEALPTRGRGHGGSRCDLPTVGRRQPTGKAARLCGDARRGDLPPGLWV